MLGKAVSSAVRGLSQSIIVYLLALALGIGISFNPIHLLAVALLIAIGSGLFSTFSLIIACIVKTRERFMGIRQVRKNMGRANSRLVADRQRDPVKCSGLPAFSTW